MPASGSFFRFQLDNLAGCAIIALKVINDNFSKFLEFGGKQDGIRSRCKHYRGAHRLPRGALGTGALRLAVQEGDLQKGCFLAGQAVAMVHQEQPAAEIIRDLMASAEPVLKGAAQWVR